MIHEHDQNNEPRSTMKTIDVLDVAKRMNEIETKKKTRVLMLLIWA